MNILKKNISIKYLYLISAFILVIMSLVIYSTYAMFTANTTSSNIASLEAGATYEFTINGTQNFNIGANSMASFNISVNNTASGSIYYEMYYSSSDDLTDVIIAELVEDKTITTNAPNTSGNLVNEGTKIVPIVISNNTNSAKTITVGVTSGFVGNAITYGTSGYPNGTKITSTYNIDDVTTGCEGNIDTSNCVEKVENGYKMTYCLTSNILLDEDPSGANRPELAEGMIPIVYDDVEQQWEKANVMGSYIDWYDYSNKKWANAVMVTNETRDTYMAASVGTPVLEADILAYWVWIPRYKYQLFNVEFLSVGPQTINITFESDDTVKSPGTTNGSWLTHPAFTFGEQELPGFWIGKFEVSSDISCTVDSLVSVGSGCNITTINPLIKPGVTSWRGAMVSTYYLSVSKMKTINYLTSEGVFEVDIRVLKNMEWGAVAYLSYSIYGKSSEIIQNDNASFYTGGGEANAYVTNVGQSTTGNITGVYDMSGGSCEYVMGVMEDGVGTGIPMSGEGTYHYRHSGFSGKLYVIANGSTIIGVSFPPPKYYDLYAYGTTTDDQTAYNRSKLGDATGETRGWYDDSTAFVYNPSPWFNRGNYTSTNVGIFAFNTFVSGGAFVYNSTRFSLSVN